MPFVALYKAKLKASNKRPAGNAYQTADKARASFRNAYKAGISDFATPEKMAEIVDAMRGSDVAVLSSVLSPDDPGFAEMQARLAAQYTQILAESGHQEMQRADLLSRFDIDNDHSQAWIADQSERLTEQFGKGAGKVIQSVISNGMLDGVPPLEMARQLKPQLGLTQRDSDAVDRRYQSSLDAGVPRGRALAMREAYAEDLLSQRAERVARTETIAAEAAGQQSAWKQAMGDGLLSSDSQKVWIATSVGACGICAELDGQVVGINEPFITSDGVELDHPPAHPNCRCSVGMAVD